MITSPLSTAIFPFPILNKISSSLLKNKEKGDVKHDMRDKGGTRDSHTRMTDTEEILHRARAGLWWFDGPLCCASHVQF